MTAQIKLYIETVNDEMDLGFDVIHLYRGTDPALLTTSSTLVTTITLVEDQEVYEYEDDNGDANSWYAYTLYNTTTLEESTLSHRWRANDTTLIRLMVEVARRCAAGFDSTCTADGGLARIADAALEDSAEDESYGVGWWAYRHAASAAADKAPRRITGYSEGGWAVSRAWSAEPSNGEAYHVYGLMPPVDVAGQAWSWLRAVNEGLEHCRWIDVLNLGDGDGRNAIFSFAAHLGYLNPARDIRAVRVRKIVDSVTGEYVDVDWTKNGRFWTRMPDGDDYKIRLHPAPPDDSTVMVEVRRKGSALYASTDATNCPFEMAIEAGAWRALEWLTINGRGDYAAQAKLHKEQFELRRREHSALGVVLV